MENNAAQQHKQEELDRLIEGLPEELQSLCSSGRSVLDLSHLVKNILQMVSGSAEIMQLALERREYERVAKSWTIFEPNFERLKKFVLDLIKYTKQYPLNAAVCDVNEAVRRGLAGSKCLWDGRAVSVEFRPGKDVPAGLSADAERLGEIAGNLVVHAADNLGEQEGTIVVATAWLEASKELELTVRDDGPALPVDVIRLLRLPVERARNMCGTGYEIPLAGLYAQQHGGYMEIDSTPPKGNAVCVYLPMRQS